MYILKKNMSYEEWDKKSGELKSVYRCFKNLNPQLTIIKFLLKHLVLKLF